MTTFRDELRQLLNKHNMEAGSDSPDFILSEYLHRQLEVFDATVKERDRWYGRVSLAAGSSEPLPVRASGLDEFSSAHGVLPPITIERCPGSGRRVGPREHAAGARCPTCLAVVKVIDNGAAAYFVDEHDRTVV
jgi:hypothetical protein